MKKILESVLAVFLFFSVGTCVKADPITEGDGQQENGSGSTVVATLSVEGEDSKSFETVAEAIKAAGTKKATITLVSGNTVSKDIEISENQDITLDLNGQTMTINDGVYFDVYGKLEIKDSTADVNGPTVSEDFLKVTYNSGKIDAKGDGLTAWKGGQITITSGTVESRKGNWVEGDKTGVNEFASKIIVNGGYIHSNADYPALTVEKKGAALEINGGVIQCDDAAAVAGNGTNTVDKKCGGTHITITGGTLISNNKTSGYLSMGIYHPQSGDLTITGGTLYSSAGNGVCVRGGTVNISGDTKIIAKGTSEGECGDSKKVTASSAIFVDYESKYYDKENTSVTITGGEFTADVAAIQVLGTSGNDSAKVQASGGTFSSDVSSYLVTGNEVVKVGDEYRVVNDNTTIVDTQQNTLGYDETVVNHIQKLAGGGTIQDEYTVTPLVLTDGDKYKNQDVAEEWKQSNYKKALEEALKDVENINEVIPFYIALQVTDKEGGNDLIDELNEKSNFTLFLNSTSLEKVKDKKFTLYNIYFENDEFVVTSVTDEKTTVVGNSISFKSDRFSVYALVTFNEVTPTATPETKKSTAKATGGYDDGSPFTTDTCGNVFDRWGNKIYEAKGCNVGGYNLVRTSVED